MQLDSGLLAAESSELLRAFFVSGAELASASRQLLDSVGFFWPTC
jgi:hypothetical protein